MMRYSLRTLVVLLLVVPPFAAWLWREYQKEGQLQVEHIETEGGIILVESGDGPPEELKNVPIDERMP